MRPPSTGPPDSGACSQGIAALLSPSPPPHSFAAKPLHIPSPTALGQSHAPHPLPSPAKEPQFPPLSPPKQAPSIVPPSQDALPPPLPIYSSPTTSSQRSRATSHHHAHKTSLPPKNLFPFSVRNPSSSAPSQLQHPATASCLQTASSAPPPLLSTKSPFKVASNVASPHHQRATTLQHPIPLPTPSCPLSLSQSLRFSSPPEADPTSQPEYSGEIRSSKKSQIQSPSVFFPYSMIRSILFGSMYGCRAVCKV